MQNDIDLSHVTKLIQKNLVQIAELRKEADEMRQCATRRDQEGNHDGRRYYDQQEANLETQANNLTNENTRLTQLKNNLETRIMALEHQRVVVASTQPSQPEQLAHIDQELAQLRGSNAML